MTTYEILNLRQTSGETRRDWARLVNKLELNPSLAPDWVDVTISALASTDDISVLVQSDSEGTIGVVPFLVSRATFFGVSLRAIELASNLTSYHAELISQEEPKVLLTKLLDSIPKWDVLSFANVDIAGRTADAIRRLATDLHVPLHVIAGDTSPYLTITESWEAFVGHQKKKFRYNLRHRRDLIEAAEGSRMVWYQSPDDVETVLSQMLTIEAQSWKVQRGIDIPSRPTEREYYSRLLPMLAANGNLLSVVLYLHDRPIAYALNCHIGGWVGHMKTSFVESDSRLSPGAFVIDCSIQRAFEIGAKEFDFLGGADRHKRVWTECQRSHASFFLFAPCTKARIIGHLKKLNDWVRSKLQSTVGDEETI